MSFTHADRILGADVTATGTLVASGPGRIRSLVVETGASAGDVVFKDGGASGTELFTINTHAGAGLYDIQIPEPGVAFGTDVHATLTNVAGVTAFYSASA